MEECDLFWRCAGRRQRLEWALTVQVNSELDTLVLAHRLYVEVPDAAGVEEARRVKALLFLELVQTIVLDADSHRLIASPTAAFELGENQRAI